jgi:hypothetical protein
MTVQPQRKNRMTDSALSLSENQSISLSDLAVQINAEHRKCEAAFQSGLQHVNQAGRLLIEAKKLCQHVTWLSWLDDNFDGSSRTAQSYMQIVDRLDSMVGYGIPSRRAKNRGIS